ncbi:nitrate reductase subunit beta, partial [Bacillus velezensis]
DHIRSTLKKMSVMRQYMRAVQTNKSIDPALVSRVGLTEQQIEDMYRLLAIAKYDDRFVIPSSHREEVAEVSADQGRCGVAFTGG